MRNNQRRARQAAQEPPPQVYTPTLNNTGLAYVVPTEFVELPSRGQFYPQDHPYHMQEAVEIKFMTAKDEDILSSAVLIEKGLVVDRLLESIIIGPVDPLTLLIGDRSAIMIAARISSYGADYKATVNCPMCATSVNYTFDLKSSNTSGQCFDNKFLEDDDDDDEAEKSLSEFEDENMVTATLSSIVVSVNGNTDSSAVEGFIDNMPAADSKFIRTLYPELAPNIDLKQEFICENCAHKTDLEVPLTAEFFWPG